MSELAEFLLARITEDEGDARSLGGELRGVAWQDGAGTPDRVLAECEAKRRIIGMMDNVLQSFSAQNGGPGRQMWDDVNRRERHHANETLYALAMPYADHPDYREEWRP